MKICILICALFSVLLLGCTSLHERAEKHYRDGEFIAASAIYEEILAKSPTDPVARERLQLSRQRLIEDRLIRVREQRLSENFPDALDKLTKIVDDEATWSLSPSGVAFSTQAEEVRELFSWYSKQIKDEIAGRRFLKGRTFLESYKSTFASGSTKKRLLALEQDLAAGGLSHCREMAKIGSGVYSKNFVSRYCLYWGASDSVPERTTASQKIVSIGGVSIKGGISGLPKEVLPTLSDDILKGIKGTPFFAASSSELDVTLNGNFISKYGERQVVRTHSYEVQVPYQIVVTVPYFEQEPYTAYQTQYNFQTQSSYQVPYTAYRTVTRYRNVPITKYRAEPRTMAYPATEFMISYVLIGELSFRIDGVNHRIPLGNQYEENSYYHDAQDSSIGLEPKTKEYVPAVSWLNSSFEKVSEEVDSRITKAWEAHYCRVPKDMLRKTQIEVVMKCLRGSKEKHEFVENWFKANFGLPVEEVQRAIGVGA